MAPCARSLGQCAPLPPAPHPAIFVADGKAQDLSRVVEDLIIAVRGALPDGVLAARLDRLDVTTPWSADPEEAKSRNRALQAVLLKYDQTAKKNGLHVLQATYDSGHVLHQGS